MLNSSSQNFLGIDYGSSHCGLAISLNKSLPLSFATLVADPDELIKKIKEIVTSNSIGVIVVGVPFSKVHGKGQEKEIIGFIDRLKKEIPGVLIEEADEAMTSKLAGRYVANDKEHQEAARIILEDWLNKLHNL